jgi:hypothetical protein
MSSLSRELGKRSGRGFCSSSSKVEGLEIRQYIVIDVVRRGRCNSRGTGGTNAYSVKAVGSLCSLDRPLVGDDGKGNALDFSEDRVADEALDFIL